MRQYEDGNEDEKNDRPGYDDEDVKMRRNDAPYATQNDIQTARALVNELLMHDMIYIRL